MVSYFQAEARRNLVCFHFSLVPLLLLRLGPWSQNRDERYMKQGCPSLTQPGAEPLSQSADPQGSLAKIS